MILYLAFYKQKNLKKTRYHICFYFNINKLHKLNISRIAYYLVHGNIVFFKIHLEEKVAWN